MKGPTKMIEKQKKTPFSIFTLLYFRTKEIISNKLGSKQPSKWKRSGTIVSALNKRIMNMIHIMGHITHIRSFQSISRLHSTNIVFLSCEYS